MHAKFAARLAGIAKAKRKAQGPEALRLWWDSRFGHLPKGEFMQVMEQLKRLG